MIKEIKEILENIKKQNEWEGVEYFRTPLSNEYADKILNYITNLQQENKAKTHQIEVLEEIVNYERNIRNDKLQQENKELNRMCELYSKSLYKAELTVYKSRCEKAIEYTETFRNKFLERMPFVDMRWYDIQHLLNILNGSDD